jgi:hypothetical protein
MMPANQAAPQAAPSGEADTLHNGYHRVTHHCELRPVTPISHQYHHNHEGDHASPAGAVEAAGAKASTRPPEVPRRPHVAPQA